MLPESCIVPSSEDFDLDQYVFRQDETGPQATSMWFVNSGCVSVEVDGVEVALLRQGNSFGELGLMLEQGRKASVRVVQESRLLELRRHDFFENILTDYPVIASKIYDGMSDEVKAHVSKEATQQTFGKAGEATEKDVFGGEICIIHCMRERIHRIDIWWWLSIN